MSMKGYLHTIVLVMILMVFANVKRNKRKSQYIGVCSDAYSPEFMVSIPIAILAVIFIFPLLEYPILISGFISIIGSISIGMLTFFLFSVIIKPIIINKIK